MLLKTQYRNKQMTSVYDNPDILTTRLYEKRRITPHIDENSILYPNRLENIILLSSCLTQRFITAWLDDIVTNIEKILSQEAKVLVLPYSSVVSNLVIKGVVRKLIPLCKKRHIVNQIVAFRGTGSVLYFSANFSIFISDYIFSSQVLLLFKYSK